MTTTMQSRTAQTDSIVEALIFALGTSIPDTVGDCKPVRFYDDMGVRELTVTGELTCIHIEIDGIPVRLAIHPLRRVPRSLQLGVAS